MRYELITLCAMPYAPCSLPFALCHLRVVLFTFGRFLSPVKEVAMLGVHRESGGFTPWNSSSACLLAKSDRIGRARLDFLNQSHVNPLGLHAPCSFPLPSALCSLPYALCPMLYALSLCAMLATLLGFAGSLSRDPIKLHQLTTRVELFYFILWIFVIPLGHALFPRGHPMGRGVREYKGGSRFALICMN